MKHMKQLIIAGSLAAIAATGCENPADGKVAAKVEETAKPKEAASAKPAAEKSAKPMAEKKMAPAFKVEGDHKLVAADSKIEWVGSKVTGKHEGGFKKFEAAASLKDGEIEGGKVMVKIMTDSIHSDDDKLTGHLSSDEFFDVKKFPEAHFVSTDVKKGGEGNFSHTVTGNLTLHGETKKITFPATITKDGDKVKVASEFVINRKDFGMAYPGKPDDLIRDEVVIKLDLALAKA